MSGSKDSKQKQIGTRYNFDNLEIVLVAIIFLEIYEVS